MKRCSFAVRTFLAAASLFVAGLGAAPVAQAGLKFDGSPGSGAPPATLGGYTMVPSPLDTRDDGSTVSDAPATPTSSFTFDQSQEILTIPLTWCTTNWAGGTYAGPVYYSQGASTMTITLPSPSSAVYLYATPNDTGTFTMKATATGQNGASVASGGVPVPVSSCQDTGASAQYFGFYGTNNDKITSVTVSIDDLNANQMDFAVGDFAVGDGSQVVDDDLTLSGMPSDMTVDAASPAGAVVSYTAPTATDEDAAAVVCSSPSGSTFSIGTTTVTCTATDAADSNSPVSQTFVVTVVGAAGQLSDLANAVNGVKPGTSLPGKVAAAQTALAAGGAASACQALDSFISEVAVQTGKHVPIAVGPSLVSAAQQIEAVLGCTQLRAARHDPGH